MSDDVSFFSRIMPRPRLSFYMFVIWLTVQMSISPGNLILAGILAIIIPIWTTRFWPNAPRSRNLPLFIRYVVVFLYDVLIANLQVAYQIVMPQERLKPAFIFIPLEIEHPFTITVFASTISLTPGTVSSHVSDDRKMLIVHALHCEDEEALVREIKERYERPLKEIFE